METATITRAVAEIDTEVFGAMYRSGVPMAVFDARPPKPGAGRIRGARYLAPDAPEDIVSLAVPDKNALVVTYCGGLTCPASARLAEHLRTLGYANVLRYPQGYAGWQQAGYPVDTT